MADLFDNPMGLDGFEFVEFAAPQADVLEPLFQKMGFAEVARHRSKDVSLYRQGDINFIVNREPGSHAAYFAQEHTVHRRVVWRFGSKTPTGRTAVRWNWVRSRWIFPPAPWNCACLRSKASAARPCI